MQRATGSLLPPPPTSRSKQSLSNGNRSTPTPSLCPLITTDDDKRRPGGAGRVSLSLRRADTPGARHTSHVTRHTSHVTRQTSHVTRHTRPPAAQVVDELKFLGVVLRHKTAGNAGKVFAVHAQSVTEIQRGKVAKMLQKYSGGRC